MKTKFLDKNNKSTYIMLLFIFVAIIVLFMINGEKMRYKYKKYDNKEQIIELFNTNKESFFSVANILRTNEIFDYLQNKIGEDELMKPPIDATQESYFENDDFEELKEFFDKTKPYQIRQVHNGLQFEYQLKSFWKTEIVSILYFYETKHDIEDGINRIKKYYSNIHDLCFPNWFITDNAK